MAVNLVTAGIDVVGFNRSPWNADRFVELGGRRAMFVSEAVAGADAVITMRISRTFSRSILEVWGAFLISAWNPAHRHEFHRPRCRT